MKRHSVGRRLLVGLELSALAGVAAPVANASYTPPPATGDSWYWEINSSQAGLAGLPATSAAYPAPGSAHIWDTDLFMDSNTSSGQSLGIPTGASPVVQAIHAAGHYSICYVEVGAFQSNFPDNADFNRADFGNYARRHNYAGYANEWWFDIRGFRDYRPGHPGTLKGAARNIAAALAKRFRWCKLEGQDAVEPDDIEIWDTPSVTGAPGGGWGVTRADNLGFERWIADQVHADGMAVFQKNDATRAATLVRWYDGVIAEECNHAHDPCAGPHGDWNAYLAAHKPVLNAEYTQDGETVGGFCAADQAWGIWGALFSVNLDGSHYQVCWNAQNQL